MHSSPGWICVNGSFVKPEDATVSVMDSGFLLGDGLFESLRATDCYPYLLDRHLRRLFDTAVQYEFTDVPSVETITEWVHATLERAALREAYVRITITRGAGAIGLAPPVGPPTVVVVVLPVGPPPQADETVAVMFLPQNAHQALPAKSTSWQHAILARRSVEKAGADEGIYVSEGGHVLEAVASNVFVVTDDRLLTSPVNECLPGITRRRVLELAREHGVPVSEDPIQVDLIKQAEAVFLTNSVQGLRRVESIDGDVIGASRSTTFGTLHALYELDRRGNSREMP